MKSIAVVEETPSRISRAKAFVRRNGKNIALVVLSAGATTVTVILLKDKAVVRDLRLQSVDKDALISALQEDCDGLARHCVELRDLCERKDAFFKAFISHLLRRGIPEGGAAMRDLRTYREMQANCA